jgi:hypothetical protein
VKCTGGFLGKEHQNICSNPDSELFIAMIKKELEKVNECKITYLNWPEFRLRIIGKRRIDSCHKIFTQIRLVSLIELVDAKNRKPIELLKVDL